MRMVLLMQADEAGSIEQLAATLHVTPRTAYRDLDVLKKVGVPCYHDHDDGRYRIRRDYYLPPMQLTATEALALAALAGEIGQRGQVALTEPAARALEKIKGRLPDAILREVSQIQEHIEIRLPPTGTAGDEIRDVYERVKVAIEQGRALQCRYESLAGQGEDQAFLFEPYALTFDQRAWYTIGFHHGRGAVRQLKLSRFTMLELTQQRYEVPGDFSIDAFRGDAWRMIRGDKRYEVEIHIAPRMAETLADTQWHRTQEVEHQPDGSLVFRCSVEGLDEIVWWVLGYGPFAKVVKPAELVSLVRDQARQMTAVYEHD